MFGSINNASADTIQQATNAVQQTYTVQTGDTLSGIAAKFNTTIDQLQQLNQLPNINLLAVGQQLKINGQAVQTVQQTSTATQTVTKWVPKTVYHTVNVPVQSGANQNANNSRQAAVAQSTPATNSNNVATNNSNTDSNNNTSNGDTGLSSSEQAAKDWIMQRESGGNYNACNGQYVGAFQLSSSYLHGDYSPANQNRVADQYVAQRYGSWTAAQRFWSTHNYY